LQLLHGNGRRRKKERKICERACGAAAFVWEKMVRKKER
jgi:hypothetical protein